jgi:uncharacterized membrane protein
VILRFSRAEGRLLVQPDIGAATWHEAHNNAASYSRGPWPNGEYEALALIPVTGIEGQSSGKFGPWFMRFSVANRSGMGIHAGRNGQYDGLGRGGPAHATMGCIRTTDAAMSAIASAWEGSATLTVED